MKHFISVFLTITLFSFLSCGKGAGDAEETDTTGLTIAVLPTYDCIPFYYAQQEGIFDSLGVNIRLVTYKSSMDADTAFVNGEVLGAVTDIVKAALWSANGDSLKVVMAMDPDLSLVTANAARLFQASSIKERIVAITRHSMLDFTTDKILQSVKMVSTDLNKPQINDIVLRTRMNDQNQYDGALLPEPYTTDATRIYGGKLISSSRQLGLHYMATLVFTDSIVNRNREDITKIIAGYQIAAEQLNRSRQYPLNYIPKDNTIEIPDSMFEYQEIAVPDLPSTTLFSDVNTWLIGRGLVKKAASYSSVIDSTFIRK